MTTHRSSLPLPLPAFYVVTPLIRSYVLQFTVVVVTEVLLYVYRNRRFIRDGSRVCPPRLLHSFWALTDVVYTGLGADIPVTLALYLIVGSQAHGVLLWIQTSASLPRPLVVLWWWWWWRCCSSSSSRSSSSNSSSSSSGRPKKEMLSWPFIIISLRSQSRFDVKCMHGLPLSHWIIVDCHRQRIQSACLIYCHCSSWSQSQINDAHIFDNFTPLYFLSFPNSLICRTWRISGAK